MQISMNPQDFRAFSNDARWDYVVRFARHFFQETIYQASVINNKTRLKRPRRLKDKKEKTEKKYKAIIKKENIRKQRKFLSTV